MKKRFQSLVHGLLIALVAGVIALRPSVVVRPDQAFAAQPTDADSITTLLVQPASPARTEDRVFKSASVARDLHYLIYLPPGYDASPDQRYAVLYMLHGRGGSYAEWANYGLLDKATNLIETNVIQPFLIVLPQGDQEYWVDHANNGPRWGAYVARDLVSEVDSHFRTLASREKRAVGGVSMGGCGALQIAMNFSDVFGIVGAHSPALRTRDTAPDYFGDQAWFDTHSPVPLFKAHPERARTLKLRIDMGAQDTWSQAAEAFHQQLVAEGVPHTWLSRSGGHSGDYWTSHVDEYLRFYSSAFLGAGPS